MPIQQICEMKEHIFKPELQVFILSDCEDANTKNINNLCREHLLLLHYQIPEYSSLKGNPRRC